MRFFSGEKTWAAITALLFAVLAGWGILNHELWRDELQAWMLARDSASLAELFRHLRYEGHPALWHLLLFPLTRLSSDPILMQVLHWGIATASAWLLLRFAHFGRATRVLLVFSYFLFYEYTQISRNYALAVLLLLLICRMNLRYTHRPLLTAALLAVLANTSIHGLLLSFSMAAALLTGFISRPAIPERKPRHSGLFSAGLIFGAGVVLSVWQMIPPPDRAPIPWFLKLDAVRAARVLATLWKSLCPLPPLQVEFWNHNLLDAAPVLKMLQPLLALFLLLWALTALVRSRRALVLFSLNTGGLFLFFYAVYFGYLRHHGFLFLGLLAALWLSENEKPESIGFRLIKLSADMQYRLRQWGFAALLVVQLLAGGIAYSTDLAYPFSAARQTARFIQQEFPEPPLLLGYPDFPVSSLCGFLGGKIYYPESGQFESFLTWNSSRMEIDTGKAFRAGQVLAQGQHQPVLVVLNQPPPEVPPFARPIAAFTRSIEPAERYYLYLIKFP